MLQFYNPWKDKKTSFDAPENIRKPKVGLDWSKLKTANKEFFWKPNICNKIISQKYMLLLTCGSGGPVSSRTSNILCAPLISITFLCFPGKKSSVWYLPVMYLCIKVVFPDNEPPMTP